MFCRIALGDGGGHSWTCADCWLVGVRVCFVCVFGVWVDAYSFCRLTFAGLLGRVCWTAFWVVDDSGGFCVLLECEVLYC